MDLHRHIRLLWRSKLLIAAGAIVGILLGVLASYKISGSGLELRKTPIYTAQTKLMVTQNGFPWGRTTLPGTATSTVPNSGKEAGDSSASSDSSVNFADPGRLSTLAWMYSHFLMGDQVKAMIKNPPADMTIDAAPITAGGNLSAGALPLIGLTITTADPKAAQRLTREVPQALEEYLTKEQNASKTPAGDRVEITTVNRSPFAMAGKSKAMMMSLVIFMMGVAAAVALAYILENLRMSSRNVETLADRRDAEPPHQQRGPAVREAKPIARADGGSDAGWASGPPSTQNRFSSGSR
jgi:capsular polysaccharide biosynthesis protein